jgi:STAS domain-containing protein
VALSILNVFRQAWWPYQTILGRVPGMSAQHDRQTHPDADELPGVDLPVRGAAALRQRLDLPRPGAALAATDPRPKWIVIAAEPVTDVDTTAADMLEALDEELNAIGISLVFAGLEDRVWEKVGRYELIGPLEPHFFPTLYVAIDEFRRQTGGRVEAARHPPHGADPEGPAHPRNRGGDGGTARRRDPTALSHAAAADARPPNPRMSQASCGAAVAAERIRTAGINAGAGSPRMGRVRMGRPEERRDSMAAEPLGPLRRRRFDQRRGGDHRRSSAASRDTTRARFQRLPPLRPCPVGPRPKRVTGPTPR